MFHAFARQFFSVVCVLVCLSARQIFGNASRQELWSASGLAGISVTALAIHPALPGIIYAGTDGEGVYRSADGTETWNNRSAGITDLFIRDLVIDPVAPETLYVGTRDSGVFKSTDSGENWSAVNDGLLCPYIYALAIDPKHTSTLYAGTLCGMYKSIDGGDEWYEINTGLPDTFIFKLAVNPQASDQIYAGTEYNRPPPGDGPEEEVVAESVFKSLDGGDHWQGANNGLPVHARVHSLAIDPVSPSTLYVGISVGGTGVYKTVDGGQNWLPINEGMPVYANIVLCLAVNPLTPGVVYAGTDNNGVFHSQDGGLTWSSFGTGLPDASVQAIVIHPQLHSKVYVGTGSGIYSTGNGTFSVYLPIAW